MLAYENEITLVIFDEEETENLQSDNTTEPPESATKCNNEIDGLCTHAYVATGY